MIEKIYGIESVSQDVLFLFYFLAVNALLFILVNGFGDYLEEKLDLSRKNI